MPNTPLIDSIAAKGYALTGTRTGKRVHIATTAGSSVTLCGVWNRVEARAWTIEGAEDAHVCGACARAFAGSAPAAPAPVAPAAAPVVVEVGAAVMHPRYGVGKITKVTVPGARFAVRFASMGGFFSPDEVTGVAS